MATDVLAQNEELQNFLKSQGAAVAPEAVAPQKRKICVAILTYDTKGYWRSMLSLMQAVMQCGQQGWGFCYILREADSMVARGRSFLASQFLENPECKDCTDLVFVDVDLTWEGNEFIRLLSHNVDIVGAAYPYKNESGDFPLRWPMDGLMEENGLWIVEAVTPGFMAIKRRVLEKMAMTQPYLEFKDRDNPEGHRSWMFFDNIQRQNGVYDEGYVFCERARQAGFKTYLDPDLRLSHIGTKAYNNGTIREWLEKKSETIDRLQSEFPHIPPLKLVKAAMENNGDQKIKEQLAKEPVPEPLPKVEAPPLVPDTAPKKRGRPRKTETPPGDDHLAYGDFDRNEDGEAA